MLLKQIKYFIDVVDYNNFTEAAERNFISQSAVSQQIKALEESLGVKLLHRGKRKFTLTEAGSYMYKHGKTLLDNAHNLYEEVSEIGRKESCECISIGYLKMYNGKELQTSIALLRQQYPEVIIHVKSAGHEELYRGMTEGRFDFVLNDECFDVEENGFEYFTLKQNEVYIEVSDQHELARRKYVEAGDANELPCIVVVDREQRSNERAYYINRYKNLEDKFIFASDRNEARMLAAAGAGFLVVINTDGNPASETGMKRIPVYLNGAPINWGFYFIRKREKQSEAKKYLLKLVLEQFGVEEEK